MNEKEVAEIRRRFRADRSNIAYVRGCYVNEQREILSEFNQSMALLGQEESEKFLAILKKTLSGTLGKNLLDISFSTQQVVSGAEHKLLMALRDSSLKDPDAVHSLFQAIISSLSIEGSYLILLACDAYDIPYRGRDDEIQADASDQVYTYFLCSICPIKPTKPALGYDMHENVFHDLHTGWVVSPPVAGFLFPAFDDRSTNLYGALYYTKDVKESQDALIEALFHTQPPMPAEVQKESFQALLGDSLGEESSYQVVQAVHSELRDLMEEHKASHEPQPLVLSREAVGRVLSDCGATEEQVDAFTEGYASAFGADQGLRPRNVVNPKQLEITTADVTIRLSPDRGDLVETRIIDGARYILIRAEDQVNVNGVPVHIS